MFLVLFILLFLYITHLSTAVVSYFSFYLAVTVSSVIFVAMRFLLILNET